LAQLAKRTLSSDRMTVVIVGPRTQLMPQLAELELGRPVLYNSTGEVLRESEW
jgi:hypothetical protein